MQYILTCATDVYS